jgi:hypothetical protein
MPTPQAVAPPVVQQPVVQQPVVQQPVVQQPARPVVQQQVAAPPAFVPAPQPVVPTPPPPPPPAPSPAPVAAPQPVAAPPPPPPPPPIVHQPPPVQQPPLVQQPPSFTAAPIVEAPVYDTPSYEAATYLPPAPAPAEPAAPVMPAAPSIPAPPVLSDSLPYIVERKPLPPPEQRDGAVLNKKLAARPFVPSAQLASPGTDPVGDDGSGAATMSAAAGAASTADAEAGEVAEEPTWPCPDCYALVPMSLDRCNVCGAGFLAGARQGHSLHVPFFGDVGKVTQSQRWLIGGLVSFGLMGIIIVLATIFGSM